MLEVISGELPKAMGMGPIMMSPPNPSVPACSLPSKNIPVIIEKKPAMIRIIPVRIEFSGVLILIGCRIYNSSGSVIVQVRICLRQARDVLRHVCRGLNLIPYVYIFSLCTVASPFQQLLSVHAGKICGYRAELNISIYFLILLLYFL